MSGLDFILDLSVVALVAGFLGLLCRRLRLSPVVGFLAAGIVVGPHTPPFQLVQDLERIRMLADLGLLFLVFGIGLGFSIQRIQRLGIGLAIGTALGALLVLAGVRLGAAAFGLSTQQALFVAAVLMVSSSAIISKVLEEIGANHTRWGQMALGVTLMEDVVAVVMLTLLSSLAGSPAGSGGQPILHVLTSFTGFAALLFLIVLLAVPRMLRYLKREATEELLMLLIAGLLLVLGWMAVRLGYSMALTAFILGAIIGSTPHRPEVDRLFAGMRHLFGAVFFTAMGMMFDIGGIADFWPIMLALLAAAFLLRVPATALALSLTGSGERDALRASLTLTPLGEFSFVIAFLGVQSGVMPEAFYPAAVGASLLTCLLSPVLIKRADPIAETVAALMPASLSNATSAYRRVLEGIAAASDRSSRWKMMAPAITRVALLLLLLAGGITLVDPVYRIAEKWLGPDLLIPSGTAVSFLLVVGVILLGPILAIWRSLSTLATALTNGEQPAGSAPAMLRIVIRRSFLFAIGTFGILWLAAVLPTGLLPLPLLASVLLILALLLALLWRNLAAWQTQLEGKVKTALNVETAEAADASRWAIHPDATEGNWRFAVHEVVLPPNARHAGRTLVELRLRADFNASIVGIDRHGFAINNPSGRERIYPGDRLLVLGPESTLTKAVAYLAEFLERPDWTQQFDDLCTGFVTIADGASCHGKSLRELDLLNRHGVQVGGVRRDGAEIISPNGSQQLQVGDTLLLLGTRLNIRRLQDTLLRPPQLISENNPAILGALPP